MADFKIKDKINNPTPGGTSSILLDTGVEYEQVTVEQLRTMYLTAIYAGSNVFIADNGDGTITIDAIITDTTGEANTASNYGATGIGFFRDKSGEDLRFKRLIVSGDLQVTDNGDAVSLSFTETGEANTSSNLGTAVAGSVGLFESKVGEDLQFNSLIAGSNVTLTKNADGTISIAATAPDGGEANTASNLGSGVAGSIGLFNGKVGSDLQFKSLLAGANVTITDNGDGTVSIAGEVNSGESNTASNVGTGAGWFKGKSVVDLQFKSLIVSGALAVTENLDDITLHSDAEANTASNLGTTGESVFSGKVGVDFQFRRLVAGSGISMTSDVNTITIESVDAGEINTASNLGTGFGVFRGKVGVDFQFNTLNEGSNIAIANDGAGNLTISATDTGEVNTVSNLGGAVAGAVGLFESKSGADLQFSSLLAGANVTLTKNADGTISIDATTSGGGEANTGENLGTGTAIYNGKVGSALQFKTLTATGATSITDDGAGNLTISSTDTNTGEVNTAANIGNGTGWFKEKAGQELRFKSIVAGANLTLTEATDGTITLDAATGGDGEANTTSNAGVTGAGLALPKSGTDLPFKRIAAGANVTITENTDHVLIDAAASGEVNTASNLGAAVTGSVGLFESKAGSDLQFNSLIAGANTTITKNADGTITVDTAAGGTGGSLDTDLTINGVTSGGMKDGEILPAGMTFDEFARKWLIVANPVTYVEPSVSLSVTGSPNLVECGTSIDLAETATYTQNDGGACTGVTFKKNGTAEATDSTAPYAHDPTALIVGIETLSYVATAAHEAGPVKNNNLGEPDATGQIQAGSVDSNTVNIKGARAGFFGVDNADNTSAAIRGLGKHVLDLTGGQKVTLSIPAGASKVTFAILATFPAVASVKYVEGSNVEVKDNFSVTQADITGAGGFVAASYDIYTYIPAAPFTKASTYEITL
jgi:hypothetical protein